MKQDVAGVTEADQPEADASVTDLLELIQESLIVFDSDRRITRWNKASERMYGWTRDKAEGKRLEEVFGGTSQWDHEQIGGLSRNLSSSGTFTRKTARGRDVVVLAQLSLLKCAAGEPLQMVETGIDVTAQQTAVRESEAFYADMFHGAAFSAWHLNATGARAIYARLREQGVSDFREEATRHPELIDQIMDAIRVVDVNETSLRLFGAKDRSEMIGGPITPYWFPDRLEALIGSLEASFMSQPTFESLTPMRTLKGEEIEVLFTRSSSSALRNAGHLLLAIVDMTDKVKAQSALAEMQASFAHAQRVSSLGELTASIAHEINQPLAAVAANGEATIRWLARETPDLERLRGLAEDIIADARRASDVVSHIRSMASPQVGLHKPVSMTNLVEEALTLLGSQLTKCGAQPSWDLQPEISLVLGDSVQLQQVIVNLVMNALQAMAGKQFSKLVLRTRNEAESVVLTVEDNGPGIRPEDLDRLFGSFFTTKPDGMGIGLAICRTIVQAHGGVIFAENIPAGGARFTVRLPAI